jgi:membrane protein DedA with SNARE-associated domain
VSFVTSELARVSGPVALLLIAALVFGETAVFLGFVIPGETAAVLGGLAVLLGRFVAVLRALMPAVAGTTRMPYRTFLIYNVLGGIIWGVGYCLLGSAAGSAYAAIERTVGTGVAIALAVVVLAAVAFWGIRRHRREGAGLIGDLLIPDAARRVWSTRPVRNAPAERVSRAFVRRCGPGPVGPGY